ncbi:L-rhamnose mutarotase [Sphingomonas sp. S1-29]|uniref:L-rhamnose mutarotase n=1 Tax=Sphingomonas sp. S1-29 TaxID=2991074 RepID=UPI00223F07B9|nr:L-rhamnose mutarotase [Sphingomonas sp. S1-29]UZK70296.1 L-rhamnose mutarotase [Sphingomonas sp. S1-29]
MGDQYAGTSRRPGARRVLLLDLKDDGAAIAQYDAAHLPGHVPAAVLASIRDAGIRDMTIHRLGTRLVMTIETDMSFDPAAKAVTDAANPEVEAWEARMDVFQQRLAFADQGAKWVEAACIFDLAEQPGAIPCG